jgi:flavin prenyltransferase
MGTYICALTGASGAVYGVRLIEELLVREQRVIMLVTDAGKIVLKREIGLDITADTETKLKGFFAGRGNGEEPAETRFRGLLSWYPVTDIAAPVASGSYPITAMAVVPCSMSTLSGIACGRSGNLLERAADVCIKEGRPLLLSPREMPLSFIHLENMLKLARAGVIIAPPMPGFYSNPESIEDLVDFVVGKILLRLGIANDLFAPWEG